MLIAGASILSEWQNKQVKEELEQGKKTKRKRGVDATDSKVDKIAPTKSFKEFSPEEYEAYLKEGLVF